MSSVLRATHLIDLCTPSISYDRQVQAACEAFDEQMFEIIDETGQVIMIPLIMDLEDETLVDILAWQFHVDFYDKTRDLEFRKRLVQMSIMWHKTKGTMALVQEVIDTYWPTIATLQEWFEYRDPFPPNYPVDDPDSVAFTFNAGNTNITDNTFLQTAHGLTNDTEVRFHVVDETSYLPQPLIEGPWYYVVNAQANSFQVAVTPNAAPVDLTGNGNNYQLLTRGTGTWHDRYRFRILVNAEDLPGEDVEAVLTLVDRYKPVSRWCDGLVRAKASDLTIGWTGMVLRFIYRTSDHPTYP